MSTCILRTFEDLSYLPNREKHTVFRTPPQDGNAGQRKVPQGQVLLSRENHIVLGSVMPGDIKYRDVNGDGRIDSDDQTPLSYSTYPLLMYGFGYSLHKRGMQDSLTLIGA
ncbi:MAG: hypothetical protein LBS03_02665 [Bacteroidales bacterium]|jgi:hypothetical protein|nr:hypothetical protein [Bacteroidales bacterium]